MPTELLLPAFALTLLANAVLIAVAIRDLRRDHVASAPARRWAPAVVAPRPSSTPPRTAALEAAAQSDPIADPPATAAETPVLPVDTSVPLAAAPLVAAARPRRARSTKTATEPNPSTPAATQSTKPAPAGARSGRSTPAAGRSAKPAPAADPSPREPSTRRGRRKFSLPPLDEDHEKVNRSIKSFLARAEGAPVGPATPAAARGAAEALGTPDGAETAAGPSGDPSNQRKQAGSSSGSRDVPTTIAVIAIAGINDPTDMSDGPDGDDPDGDTVAMIERAVRARATTDAVDLLERTLRAAARGSDEVHGPDGGRFRIVLPATGELAARAYVRRIRATVEPQLEAADRPLRLVVATATALNVPIRTATETALRRLDAALAADADGATGSMPLDGAGDDSLGESKARPRPRTAGD